MRFIFLYCFLTLHLFSYSQEVTLSKLPPKQRLDYILEHFYEIRSQNLDTGLHYIEQALLFARDAQDETKEARCHLNRGVTYYLKGDYQKALKGYQAALRLAEKLRNEGLQGQVLNELANHAKQQKEYNRAFQYLWKSERLCQEARDSNCLNISYNHQGVVHQILGNLDSAAFYFEKTLVIKAAIQDSVGLPYVYNNLAGLAIENQDFDRAIELMKASTAIRNNLKDEQGIAIDLNNMGEIYLAKGDFKEAVRFFEQSLERSRPLKFTDLIRHTLQLAGDASLQLDNFKAAYEYLKESTHLKDSLYTIEKARSIVEMQTKYETEQKEWLIIKQRQDIRLQRAVAIAVIAALLLVVALVYYRFYRQRRYEKKIRAMELVQKLQFERERISKDLHDNVGAQLTSIITKLDVLSYKARSADQPQIAQNLEKVNEGTRATMQLLRETIWAIKKDSYNLDEFAKKIKEYLQKYLEELPNLRWEVAIEGNEKLQLAPNQVLNLFRIIQEAVQNTVKYAQATSVTVTMTNLQNRTIQVVIKDDGNGMEINNTTREGQHYGLENMQQRAEGMGGRFELKTAQQQGVHITVTVPIFLLSDGG